MKPETSRGRVIVPVGEDRVKSTLVSALAGSAATVDGFAVDVTRGADTKARVDVCRRLVVVGDRTNVVVNYCLGDVYNQTPRYSKERADFVAEVEREMGKEYAARIRKCGMVSAWWPRHKRTNDHCWQWYIDHETDGSLRKPRVKRVQELEEIAAIVEDGREVIQCKTRRGTYFILRRNPK